MKPVARCRVADFRLEDISNVPSVLDGAEALARMYDFAKHPYFVWAKAPTTRLEEFRASQAPYAHYVEHFSRALAAVLARVPSIEERLTTVYENVAEEHGHGRIDGTHRNTYAGYLRAIGLSDEAIRRPRSPQFFVASQALIDFCLVNPVEMGAAAVGIVEYTHIKIARLLAQLIHERFWGDLEAQQHYRFHAEIDAEHALALFALCNDGWKNERTRERIAYAMAFSVQVWWAQFDTMCPAELIVPSATDGIRDLLDPQAQRDASERLDSGRVSCDLPVRARRVGESWQTARATSIGGHGLVLRGIEPPALDALMELSIDGAIHTPLLISGRVRSQPRNDGEFCIEFDLEGESRPAEVRAAVRSLVPVENKSE